MTTSTPTKQAADRRHAGTDNDAYRALRMQLQTFIARRVENTQAAEDLTPEVLLRLAEATPTSSPTQPPGYTGSPAT